MTHVRESGRFAGPLGEAETPCVRVGVVWEYSSSHPSVLSLPRHKRDELQLNDGADDGDAEAVPADADAGPRVARHHDRHSEPNARASGVAGGDVSRSDPDPRRPGAQAGANSVERGEVARPPTTDVFVARSEAYKGFLPHPELWKEFDETTRERILRVAEAFTTDESARRDRVVDADIRELPEGRQAAVAIVVLCLLAAAVSVFAFDNTIAAGVFLAVPIASIIRDLIRGRS